MTDNIYLTKLRSLRCLPEADKQLLASHLSISYGHAQNVLHELSIFKQNLPKRNFENFEITETGDERIFYIGHHYRTNMSVYVDESKKLIFRSRHYFSHLDAFLSNIDACIYHLKNVDLSDSLNIGSDFASIQRWFFTYGHFKDEAYSIASLIFKEPSLNKSRALLDYPTDDRLNTKAFTSNENYKKIDRLIFDDRSLNAYRLGSYPLAIRNLSLITNDYSSAIFHSFPPSVTDRVRSQVEKLNFERGPKRILLTRSVSYRDLKNKSEIEEFVAWRGYTIINPEQVSYEQLIHISGYAEKVICYWGSACTNWVYFRPGTRIVVLKSESYSKESLSFWDKVIKAYGLIISELVACENAIEPSRLDLIDGLWD